MAEVATQTSVRVRGFSPWVIASVLASAAAGAITFAASGLKVDEELHYRQAQILASGSIRPLMYSEVIRRRVMHRAREQGHQLDAQGVDSVVRAAVDRHGGDEPILAMLRGYHAMLAVPLSLNEVLGRSVGLRVSGVTVATITNEAVSLMFLVLLYCVVRSAQGFGTSFGAEEAAASLAASAWCAAIILPFHWLIYTDLLSASLVAGIVLAEQHRRPTLAAAIGLLAMAVRQTNVVFVGLAPVIGCWSELTAVRDRPLYDAVTRLRSALGRHWATAVALVVFAAFVGWNGRVSVGPTEAHNLQFSASSLAFSLVVFAACTVPLMAERVAHMRRTKMARGDLWCLTGIAAMAALGASTFAPTHDWNQVGTHPHLIHNHVAAWLSQFAVASIPVGRITLFLILVGSGILIGYTPLRPQYAAFLGLGWLLSVGPFALLEPRYSIPTISLWLVLRPRRSEGWERMQLAWGMTVGMTLVVLHAYTKLFI